MEFTTQEPVQATSIESRRGVRAHPWRNCLRGIEHLALSLCHGLGGKGLLHVGKALPDIVRIQNDSVHVARHEENFQAGASRCQALEKFRSTRSRHDNIGYEEGYPPTLSTEYLLSLSRSLGTKYSVPTILSAPALPPRRRCRHRRRPECLRRFLLEPDRLPIERGASFSSVAGR